MNSDSAREVAIFTEALKLPAEERAGFLERICGSDNELHSKLKDLLRAHDRLGNFLEGSSNGSSENDTN
jgi:hypothetical protein